MKNEGVKIKVIGIDPSPGKGSTVFDGESFITSSDKSIYLEANELRDYLYQLVPQTLVCWDAPLTGPANPDEVMFRDGKQRPYTQRCIEQFFSSNKGIKTPKGISVLPYSGCPHWTLSRALLGLPRVGKWDFPLQDLPFELVEDDGTKKRDWTRRKVVEVHPAIALFLWSKRENANWEYKKVPSIFVDVKTEFLRSVDSSIQIPKCDTDDQLDALVAYVLGRHWLDGNGVVLLGNKDTGHFLTPSASRCGDVAEKFQSFCGC